MMQSLAALASTGKKPESIAAGSRVGTKRWRTPIWALEADGRGSPRLRRHSFGVQSIAGTANSLGFWRPDSAGETHQAQHRNLPQ